MISVIVPVYNVIKYLDRCLDSIINQSYRDLEIILVDDGSTDGSGERCDYYALQDARIMAVHKENGGLSSARNYGMNYAHGEYISFIDSDDWIDNDFYRVLVEAIEQSDADIAIAGINFHYISRIKECERTIREVGNARQLLESYFNSAPGRCNAVWNRLYKRSLVEDLEFPNGMYYEDIGYTVEAFSRVKRYVVDCRVAYNYVVERPESITNKKVGSDHIMDALELYSKREKTLVEFGYDDLLLYNDSSIMSCILQTLDRMYSSDKIKNRKECLNGIITYEEKIYKADRLRHVVLLGLHIGIRVCPRLMVFAYKKYLTLTGRV